MIKMNSEYDSKNTTESDAPTGTWGGIVNERHMLRYGPVEKVAFRSQQKRPTNGLRC